MAHRFQEYNARPLSESWADYEQEQNNRLNYEQNMSKYDLSNSSLGAPLDPLGTLNKCSVQTRPLNIYNRSRQVESFTIVPISSKMVQIMMVYERPEK